MGSDGRVLEWNPAAERIFGFARRDAVGRPLADLIIPGELRAAHRNALERYLETRDSTILDRRLELTGLRSDGSELPVELSVTRVPGTEPPRFVGFLRDLSHPGRGAQVNARLQQRMAFLAQAGLVLDRSLEFRETLESLAELTVPELAQLTVIDLLEENDSVVGLAVAAAPNSEHARAVETIRREHPLHSGSAHPVASVLRSGRPILLPVMDLDFQRHIAQGSEHFELMRMLRYHSAIVVPLVARTHVLGTLSLLRMDDAPSFDPDDLVLAQELARRAALAVDNARMFESTRRLARTLQESLLPRELPDIPGVRLAARYRPAEQGQEVGGDFYDAFAAGSNRWGIVIGDVCGKGAQAAALTALARYTIRALADRDSATVLELLNDAVMREHDARPDQLLTVLFAIASARDGVFDVELAAAGHPPPLVRRADGTIEALSTGGLLIGVDPGVRYGSERLTLAPGDTLLLYTDGLTDARAPSRILSEADLKALLRRGRGMPPERLADFIERAATGGEDPRDDIALLVIEREPA